MRTVAGPCLVAVAVALATAPAGAQDHAHDPSVHGAAPYADLLDREI